MSVGQQESSDVRASGRRATTGMAMGAAMKRVLVSSPKGGSGKSNTARNLAVAAAHEGVRVATADLDAQESLTRWWQRRPAEGVPQMDHYPVAWEDAEDLLRPGGVEAAEVLFIDSPPGVEARPEAMKRLAAGVDLVLVPCRPTYDDVDSTIPYVRALRAAGVPVLILLNAVKPRVNIMAEKEALIAVAELCPVEVGDRADYSRAGGRGLGMADIGEHAAAAEMRAVWRDIARRLWPEGRAAALPGKTKTRAAKRAGARHAAL